MKKEATNRVGGGFLPPPPTPPDMRVRVRRFLAVLTDRAATLSLPRGSLPSARPIGFIAPGQDHRWSCLPAKFSPSRVVRPSGISRLVALGTTASAELIHSPPARSPCGLSPRRRNSFRGYPRRSSLQPLG